MYREGQICQHYLVKIFLMILDHLIQNDSSNKSLKLAATDGRYVRSAGIPVLGFSPIKNHPILLHDHNERMHESSIIEGRQIYIELIKSLTEVK